MIVAVHANNWCSQYYGAQGRLEDRHTDLDVLCDVIWRSNISWYIELCSPVSGPGQVCYSDNAKGYKTAQRELVMSLCKLAWVKTQYYW